MEQEKSEFPELVEETQGQWDRLAAWWDDRIGDGNDFQDVLLEPTSDRLLELKPGETVLDIACGAGRYTRRMAAQGVHVVAFDQAPSFIERARGRTTEHADRIEYVVANAADSETLLALGEGRFDAAVCTMALMDMAPVEPLISTLPRLLKPDGRFVFSVSHPAFNSGASKKVGELTYRDGELVADFAIKVTGYLTPSVDEGLGIEGQPEPQNYFHRPLGLLLNTCFEAGFVLDRLEEPALPPEQDPARRVGFYWTNYPTIPPVLLARLRLARE